MFRREFLTILVICLVVLLFAGELYAQPNPAFYGDAGAEIDGTYIVTIKKIEISQDGTTWVTLGEKECSFNIASGDVGASIGNYISNSSVPTGTYTRLRITQSRMITIKGRSGNVGGNYYYTTTSAGRVNGFYKAGSVATGGWPPVDYEAVSFQVPADAQGQAGETLEISGDNMIITKDLSSNPIVIRKGQAKAMMISFNTQNMIGFEAAGPVDYVFYPMAPQQSYSEE